MGVKPGYKQTELGMLPADWDVVPLGKHATFRTGPFGTALHKSDYTDDGVPVVNPMHIVDGKIEPTRTMTITEQAAKHLSDFRMSPGEIVIGRRGEMGRCAVIRECHTGWLCGTGSMIIRPLNACADFLQRVISSPRAISAIEDVSVGTTMVNLNQGTLSGLKVQFPPLPEQRAIASALSDMDALLSGLDRLITKKRDLKQAAMQQLLAGQTRLPGFSGVWEVKRLGEVADVLKGTALSKSLITASGAYPCILYGELFTTYGRVISDVVSRTNSSEGCRSMVGDVLLPGSTTTTGADLATASALLLEDVALGGDIIVVRRKGPSYDAVFLASYLTHAARNEIAELTQGITIHHLYGKDLKTLSLELPSLPEQTAIATVLSDMDAELTALESRRDKTRDLKHGMMQELLTGKTRLVKPEAAHA